MNKRFKPALHGVSACNLKEYVVAFGDASKAPLWTAMPVELDIHLSRDSNEPTCQAHKANTSLRIRKNVE